MNRRNFIQATLASLAALPFIGTTLLEKGYDPLQGDPRIFDLKRPQCAWTFEDDECQFEQYPAPYKRVSAMLVIG